MDVLKRELQRKRQQLDADFGGRKVLRRAEIEAREIQRLRVAERERLLQKRQKDEQLRSHPAAASSPASSSSSSMPTLPPAAVADEAKKADDHAGGSNESSLPREEVIRRLRVLRQPATLFGEDDAARLRRLHDALEDPAAVADVGAAEIGEGATNDFLRDIQALRLRARAAAKPKASAAERSAGGSEEKEEEVSFDELCDEDKIAAFFKRLLSEWGQEVDEMPEAERRTARGKAAAATCKQCARYLEPLFKLCTPASAAGRGEVLRAAGLPGGDGQLHQAGDRQLAVADRGDHGGHPRAVGAREDPRQRRRPRDERRDDEEVPAVREAAHDLLPAEVPDGPVQVGRVQQLGQWQRPGVPPRREGRQELGGDAPAGGCLLTRNHRRRSNPSTL